MQNKQLPIKQNLMPLKLHVNEIFHTIQGEGPFAGVPAVFIRLAGCNIQCHWCDTEYTDGIRMVVPSILEAVAEVTPSKQLTEKPLIVITGGEPFRQNIGALCTELAAEGYAIQIETNGILSNPNFPWGLVVLVVSPKLHRIHPEIVANAQFYKYVITPTDTALSDGLPVSSTQSTENILRPVAKPPDWIDSKNVYLSPLDSGNEAQNKKTLELCIYYCLKFGYNLSIQQHKIINLP